MFIYSHHKWGKSPKGLVENKILLDIKIYCLPPAPRQSISEINIPLLRDLDSLVYYSNFIKSKKGVSLILFPVLIIVSIYSLSDWVFNNIYLFNDNISYSVNDINSVFYNKFFEISRRN